jgi:regulatory protein
VADERARALDRAVRALAHRDHSRASLDAKLARAGVDEGMRDEVVDTLSRSGYLDDARFARSRAAQLAARGYGDDWIRGDLEQQGVSRDIVEQAVSTLTPERDRALACAAGLPDPVRAAQMLVRRGFSEDSLDAVLERPVADDPPAGVG